MAATFQHDDGSPETVMDDARNVMRELLAHGDPHDLIRICVDALDEAGYKHDADLMRHVIHREKRGFHIEYANNLDAFLDSETFGADHVSGRAGHA